MLRAEGIALHSLPGEVVLCNSRLWEAKPVKYYEAATYPAPPGRVMLHARFPSSTDRELRPVKVMDSRLASLGMVQG